MKRMILVFTNARTRRGEGLNFEIESGEEQRLLRAALRIKVQILETHLNLGDTLVLAEYLNYAMCSGHFLATQVFDCPFDTFVGLDGFIERIGEERAGGQLETLVVSCLSFAPTRAPENAFYQRFSLSWNRRCYLFGMPPIPLHECDGEGGALFIDYEKQEVKWLLDIGEPDKAWTAAITS